MSVVRFPSRECKYSEICLMENREQQILSEIKNMMGTIRAQLELLDAKMAELQQCVDPEEFDNNPIELDIEVPDDDLPFDDVTETALEFKTEPEPESEPEPEPEPEPELVVEPDPEPQPESQPEPESAAGPAATSDDFDDDDDDLPGIFDQPLPVYKAAQASPDVKPSVADVMVAEKQAWRTDMPGTPVRDVRSAISLNDRIIFINYLFDEDPIAFQNTITRINSMTDLDQVVEFVTVEFPMWDLSSELVYRFMMAVRRKVK